MCNLNEASNKCLLDPTPYLLEEIFTNEIIPQIDSLETISALSRCCRLFYQTINPNEIKVLYEKWKCCIERLNYQFEINQLFDPQVIFTNGTPNLKLRLTSINRSINYIFMKVLFISENAIFHTVKQPSVTRNEQALPSNYKLKNSVKKLTEPFFHPALIIPALIRPQIKYSQTYVSDPFRAEITGYLIKEITVTSINTEQNPLTLIQKIGLNVILQKMNQIVKEKLAFYLNNSFEVPSSASSCKKTELFRRAKYDDYAKTSVENTFFIRGQPGLLNFVDTPFREVEFHNKEQFEEYLRERHCEVIFFQDQLQIAKNKTEKLQN